MQPDQIDCDDEDLRGQIARLEAHIEKLSAIEETCRKSILMAKVAMAAGGILIFAVVLGTIRFDPVALVGGISAIIGGVVVFGSNTSTWKQTRAAIEDAEARRADLIGAIDLRLVSGKSEP